jgi:hypothetical protein
VYMEFPILNSPDKLPQMFEALLKSEVPKKFTHRFFESIGFPSSSDRGFLNLLRFVGFLDEKSVPTEFYVKFRGQTLDWYSLIISSYSQLYQAEPYIHEQAVRYITQHFQRLTPFDVSTNEGFALTFKALCNYGGLIKGPQRVADTNKGQTPTTLLPPIHVNVNLNSVEELKKLLDLFK